MISPSYITSTRSASESTSSSSALTSSTALPASLASRIRCQMLSMAPISTPRVGCAATSSSGSISISRAKTTFCILPPERVFTGAEASSHLI